MNTTDKANNIGMYLEKKIFLISQYLSATKEMNEVLMQKKDIDITKLISKRQVCINKIKKIDIFLHEHINQGSDRSAENFTKYFELIKNLLEQIAPIDSNLMLMVKAESTSVKKNLIKINTTRSATKGYGIKDIKTPRYLDARK